jgi:FMN-dependent NADH-azoreductase
MSKTLLILSSPRGEASYSTRVARELVRTLTAGDPSTEVTVRDLAAAPLPHLDGALLAALSTDPAARTAEQAAAVAQSEAAIAELKAADTIVIASAMINFGPSSTLKVWFDHVLRAGQTFRYDESGAHGLLLGKTAHLVVASGNVYSRGPAQPADFQVPYLKHLLAFMGITEVVVHPVEGVAFGPEAAEKALAGALESVAAVAAKAA